MYSQSDHWMAQTGNNQHSTHRDPAIPQNHAHGSAVVCLSLAVPWPTTAAAILGLHRLVVPPCRVRTMLLTDWLLTVGCWPLCCPTPGFKSGGLHDQEQVYNQVQLTTTTSTRRRRRTRSNGTTTTTTTTTEHADRDGWTLAFRRSGRRLRRKM